MFFPFDLGIPNQCIEHKSSCDSMKTMMLTIDEKISKVCEDLLLIKHERKKASRLHETVICECNQRMEGLQRRLDHAMDNARVHLYVDAVRNINQSPYVLLRQAILCSLLHHLDLLSTQLALLQRQHKDNVEAMISSALEIDNALVECDVNLLTLISEALESLRAVESRGLRMKLFLHSNQIEQCCLDDRSMIGEKVRCQLQEQVHGCMGDVRWTGAPIVLARVSEVQGGGCGGRGVEGCSCSCSCCWCCSRC